MSETIYTISSHLARALAILHQPVWHNERKQGPESIMASDAKAAREDIEHALHLLDGVVEYDEDKRKADHWASLSPAERDHAIRMAQ